MSEKKTKQNREGKVHEKPTGYRVPCTKYVLLVWVKYIDWVEGLRTPHRHIGGKEAKKKKTFHIYIPHGIRVLVLKRGGGHSSLYSTLRSL